MLEDSWRNHVNIAINKLGMVPCRVSVIPGQQAPTRCVVLALTWTEAVPCPAAAPAEQVAVREEVPLAYLPGNTARVRVKVIGDLDLQRHSATGRSSQAPPAASPAGAATTSSRAASGAGNEGGEQVSPSVAVQPRTAAAAGVAAEASTGGSQAAGSCGGPAASESGDEPGVVLSKSPFPGRGEEEDAARLAAWEPQVSW